MKFTPLGARELQILQILARENAGVPYWKIIYEICGCRKTECKKQRQKETCRITITRSLRQLRNKQLIYKKRYLGQINYYLTRQGKQLLLALGGNL